jgi:3-hydroxypropanoate dehydrogenase
MSSPISDAALDQLFRTARSYDRYLDKPVTTEQLHAIWELMKMGPTSANMLPARMIWCTTDEAKAKLAAVVAPVNTDKVLKAPVTVIIGMDIEYHENLPLREVSAMRNSTLQGGYFIMAARALGLDTGPMSGFSNEAVDAAFFADTPNVKSNFISTLGYGDPAGLLERAPRPEFDTFNSIA